MKINKLLTIVCTFFVFSANAMFEGFPKNSCSMGFFSPLYGCDFLSNIHSSNVKIDIPMTQFFDDFILNFEDFNKKIDGILEENFNQDREKFDFCEDF